MRRLRALALFSMLALAGCASGDDGFVPLFNGKDLSGWVNVNGAPSTWTVRDGLIACTGVPTGVLRTERQYENFILELEWRHVRKGGNAGLFIHSDALPAPGQPFTRATECQVMDGNHGDVFAIHGATMVPDRPHPKGWMRCLPSEARARPAGEWNHYRVESRDGRLTLAVNGKVVSGGSALNPRKGYICLESEGAEVYFRNIRILELPSSDPPPEAVAEADQGFVSLYNGVDLAGWRGAPGHDAHWKAADWRLTYDGAAPDAPLWSAQPYENFVLIADWRLPQEAEGAGAPVRGAGPAGLLLRGATTHRVDFGTSPEGSGGLYASAGTPGPGAREAAVAPPLHRADHPPPAWNRFVVTVRGDRLTVLLNGQTVVEDAVVPGLPARGPIGLAPGARPVEFANLFIKEIE